MMVQALLWASHKSGDFGIHIVFERLKITLCQLLFCRRYGLFFNPGSNGVEKRGDRDGEWKAESPAFAKQRMFTKIHDQI